MKKLNFPVRSIVIFLSISCFFLTGCQKDDAIFQSFLGKKNTVREYETTVWRYDLDSNSPLIKIPDTLYKKLVYDSTLISQGMVEFSLTTETIIPYDLNFNIIKDLETAESALSINLEGQSYNLEQNLRNLELNIEYTLAVIGGDGGIWIENSNRLSQIIDESTKLTFLLKPLFVGKEWVRESRKYKNSNGEYETFQQECKVLSIEQIKVKAGEFSAFKVEVINNWIDIPSKSVRAYEYYVPDVGLVLEESDGIMSQAIIQPFGEVITCTFHQTNRKELVNYTFIK